MHDYIGVFGLMSITSSAIKRKARYNNKRMCHEVVYKRRVKLVTRNRIEYGDIRGHIVFDIRMRTVAILS